MQHRSSLCSYRSPPPPSVPWLPAPPLYTRWLMCWGRNCYYMANCRTETNRAQCSVVWAYLSTSLARSASFFLFLALINSSSKMGVLTTISFAILKRCIERIFVQDLKVTVKWILTWIIWKSPYATYQNNYFHKPFKNFVTQKFAIKETGV